MSFMHLTCPWCGTAYTFGMVGMTLVGSGHKCTKLHECQHDGCEKQSTVACTSLDAPPDTWKPRLLCMDHMVEEEMAGAMFRSDPTEVEA